MCSGGRATFRPCTTQLKYPTCHHIVHCCRNFSEATYRCVHPLPLSRHKIVVPKHPARSKQHSTNNTTLRKSASHKSQTSSTQILPDAPPSRTNTRETPSAPPALPLLAQPTSATCLLQHTHAHSCTGSALAHGIVETSALLPTPNSIPSVPTKLKRAHERRRLKRHKPNLVTFFLIFRF